VVQAHADLALVERCRAHEPGAFEQVYRAHAPRLFGLAVRLVGRAEAEDVLQEIFLTAYRKLDQYRGDSSLATWLFRMGVNVSVDHLRRRGARLMRMTDGMDEEPEAADVATGPIGGVIDRIDLERAIGALPAGYRAAFVLHDVEGLAHQEIAEALGVSEGTSKSQLHRARLRLRAALAPRSLSEAGGRG
jgi:RNA polymerase sigma-70 factor (ECF subfamily)